MLIACLLCDANILTEADAYISIPHSSGYHGVCWSCMGDCMDFHSEEILNKRITLSLRGESHESIV